MTELDKSASALESEGSEHADMIANFSRKPWGNLKARKLSEHEKNAAKMKSRIEQVSAEYTDTMNSLTEIEEKVRSIEAFHEEQQNAHYEDMERLKASTLQARNEITRWESDDIDVPSELQKLQPDAEGLEEFKKETEYLENKFEVLHRDLLLQSEELMHLQSTNLELAKRIQELEHVLRTTRREKAASQKMLPFGNGLNKDITEEPDVVDKATETSCK